MNQRTRIDRKPDEAPRIASPARSAPETADSDSPAATPLTAASAGHDFGRLSVAPQPRSFTASAGEFLRAGFGALQEGLRTDASVNAPDFNPLDINHRLLRAIDQSDFNFVTMRRHVDFHGVVAALNNLTPSQVGVVRAAYAEHEKPRSLEDDLFGNGESGLPSDLKPDQQIRIRALLGGTKAWGGAPELQQNLATQNRRQAIAAELHQLLHGDLEKKHIERVMELLRGGAAENTALETTYSELYRKTLPDVLGAVGAGHIMRAAHLMAGRNAEADRLVMSGDRHRLEEIDAEIADLTRESEGFFGNPVAPMVIAQLRKERNALAQKMGDRLEASVAEAGDFAAGRVRAAAVVGDLDATVATVAGPDGKGNAHAAAIRSIALGDPGGKAAADLKKAAQSGKMSAALITETLRSLRDQADAHAKLEHPEATPEQIAVRSQALATSYFASLRTGYDALAGDAAGFDALVAKTGSDDDADANQQLMAAHGRLSPVQELVMALKGDRKDTQAVERVLKNTSPHDMPLLKGEYARLTGRTLEYDLFGEAPTTHGKENPEVMGQHLLVQGKAAGTSRLSLEDILQQPSEKGGLAEVNYLAARAEREYEYTIENRGFTGAWRDTWGNEERDLLDETIYEVRSLQQQYLFSAIANPTFVRTAEAHRMIHRLGLARATIRGDREAYEQATAELRAMFEMVASFAMQAALTAVLGPLAEALLIGKLAQGASMAMRVAKGAQLAVVNTASTIGANLAVYGNDYSLERLKADLSSGLGGAIGPAAVEKLVGPYARALVKKLGPQVNAEILAAGQAAQTSVWRGAGQVVIEEGLAIGKTVAGMETGAMAQGEWADLSVASVAQAHGMGIASDRLTTGIQRGLGLDGQHAIITEEEGLRLAEEGRASEARRQDQRAAVDGGGGGLPPSSDGPGGGRVPPSPGEPSSTPIPPGTAEALGAVAKQFDVVILARPVNPNSGEHLDRGALSKMELVKANTVQALDELIGAPPNSRGLVALFKPHKPGEHLPDGLPPGMPPELVEQAWLRYGERMQEWETLSVAYAKYEQEGLVRLEGGLLMVADPRTEGGPGAPMGAFKPVAGDVDLFDITHADGRELLPEQRTAIINVLRSMDIGIEHGAHAWWQRDSPGTYDAKKDASIRAQHTDQEPLVAFAPGVAPQRVWAGQPVTGVPREPGERLIQSLANMTIEATPEVRSAADGYIDLGDDGPGAPPERPPQLPQYESFGPRLSELMPEPVGRRAVAGGILVLDPGAEGPPEQRMYAGRSGQEEGVPRSDVTMPGRHVVRPGVEYGPDTETKALSKVEHGNPLTKDHPDGPHERVSGHAGTREHDAEAKLLERVLAETTRGDRGELHLMTNFPTCPSCIEAIFRFRHERPDIQVILHRPPPVTPETGG
jgi:hypothetical protein